MRHARHRDGERKKRGEEEEEDATKKQLSGSKKIPAIFSLPGCFKVPDSPRLVSLSLSPPLAEGARPNNSDANSSRVLAARCTLQRSISLPLVVVRHLHFLLGLRRHLHTHTRSRAKCYIRRVNSQRERERERERERRVRGERSAALENVFTSRAAVFLGFPVHSSLS